MNMQTDIELSINEEYTQAQLELVYGSEWQQQLIYFILIKDQPTDIDRPIPIGLRKYAEVREELIKYNKLGYGTFFCPNTTGRTLTHKIKKSMRGWLTNVIAIDIDVKSDDYELPKHLIEPNGQSVTPNGYHLYWKFNGQYALDGIKYKKIVSELIKYYQADNKCSNINRVYRLAGYYHHKSQPQLVTFETKENQFSLEDLYREYKIFNEKKELDRIYSPESVEDYDQYFEKMNSDDYKKQCRSAEQRRSVDLQRVIYSVVTPFCKSLFKYKLTSYRDPNGFVNKKKSKRKYSYFQQDHSHETHIPIPISMWQMVSRLTINSEYGNLETFRIYLDMHYALSEYNSGRFVLNPFILFKLKSRYGISIRQLTYHLNKIKKSYCRSVDVNSTAIYFKSLPMIYSELIKIIFGHDELQKDFNYQSDIKSDSIINIPQSCTDNLVRFRQCYLIQTARQVNGYDLDYANELIRKNTSPKLFSLERIAKILNFNYTTVIKWLKLSKCWRILLKQYIPLTDDSSNSNDLSFDECRELAHGKVKGYCQYRRASNGNWNIERSLGHIFKPLESKQRSTSRRIRKWVSRVQSKIQQNNPRNRSLGASCSVNVLDQSNICKLIDSLNLIFQSEDFKVLHTS